MTLRRLSLVAALPAVLALPGCATPEKPPTRPLVTPKTTPVESKAALQARTSALEERLRAALEKVRVLDDKTAFQAAVKNKLINLLAQAKNETLFKNPLEGTIPAPSLERLAKLLDQVDAELRAFPPK